MPTYTLSKSEFKLASDCYTRLKYKKNGYPKTSDTDEFMEMLAEGGYMVGKLATLLYPGGIDINTDKTYSDDVFTNTSQWMQQDNVVLFEAAFKTSDGRIIRVDILEKKGNCINLIEVKAKSWNSDTYILGPKPKGSDKKNILSDFKPYLEDVTFQYSVLKMLYPDNEIFPYLFLPDKSVSTSIDGLNGLFSITKAETSTSGFKSYEVHFSGDETLLKQDNLMVLVDVLAFVKANHDTVVNRAKEMLDYMNSDFDLGKSRHELDGKCKSCDYRLKAFDGSKNGFMDCWGEMAYQSNHMFDLYQFGNIFRSPAQKEELARMIRNKTITIQHIPDEFFAKENGEPKYNGRPYLQKTCKEEKITEALHDVIGALKYPLYFIDFECSRMALPYHKHMRPYEIVAYQWSCHVIEHENAEPQHYEWINTEDIFPNFKFLSSLYNQIKNAGSVLVWSSYERTVLNEIRRQYEQYKLNDLGGTDLVTQEMIDWLLRWQELDKDDHSWVCDMEKLCRQYYFHPFTKAKSSIKPTLPAILNENKSLRIINWLRNFGEGLDLYKIVDGVVQDPYHSLPNIDFENLGVTSLNDDEEEESAGDDYYVRNGGAAMRAYQDMMYGFAKNDTMKKNKIKQSLLQYCKLDTLAMVVIWKYWNDMSKNVKI